MFLQSLSLTSADVALQELTITQKLFARTNGSVLQSGAGADVLSLGADVGSLETAVARSDRREAKAVGFG